MIVRTVLGDIDPTTLGATLCHEHLLTRPPAWAMKKDSDMVLGDVVKGASELADLAAAGGGGLVEMTTSDYGRDAGGLAEIASRSSVHVIAATGYQKGVYYPETVREESAEEIAARFVPDVVTGMDATVARAGVIKFGTCRTDHLMVEEERVLEATALVHLATGVPISTHTQAGTLGTDQIDAFTRHGVHPSSLLIGHLDRNLDYGYLREIAERGVWMGFDHWTKPKYPSDQIRAQCLTKLVEEGFTRIMVAGDLGRPSYQPAYGGTPGFAGVYTAVVARIGSKAAELVFVRNPAEFFAFEPRDVV